MGSDLDVDLVIVVASGALPFVDRPAVWDTLTLPVDLRVYTAAESAMPGTVSPRVARSLEREDLWVSERA